MNTISLNYDRGKPIVQADMTDGELTVRRRAAGRLAGIFHAPIVLLPVFAVLVAFVYVTIVVIVAAVASRDAATAALGLFLGFGSIFGMIMFLGLQGVFFPFRSVLIGNKYRIRNGFFRFSVRVGLSKTKIVVGPSSSRGDYGFGASIKINGRWPLPFVPTAMVGSRRKARTEATRLYEWLVANSPVEVVMHRMWDSRRHSPSNKR